MVNLFNTADVLAARQDEIEAVFGDSWADAEAFGITILSERDFPITEDTDGVSNADWDAFLEDSWTDPAERLV